MTDSTHNTLVTVMIIIGVLIAIILIGRGFGNGLAYRNYWYQPASAIDAYQYDRSYEATPRYSDTVTSYSRPSRYTNFGSTTYTDKVYTYDTVYTYTTNQGCDSNGYCWSN